MQPQKEKDPSSESTSATVGYDQKEHQKHRKELVQTGAGEQAVGQQLTGMLLETTQKRLQEQKEENDRLRASLEQEKSERAKIEKISRRKDEENTSLLHALQMQAVTTDQQKTSSELQQRVQLLQDEEVIVLRTQLESLRDEVTRLNLDNEKKSADNDTAYELIEKLTQQLVKHTQHTKETSSIFKGLEVGYVGLTKKVGLFGKYLSWKVFSNKVNDEFKQEERTVENPNANMKKNEAEQGAIVAAAPKLAISAPPAAPISISDVRLNK